MTQSLRSALVILVALAVGALIFLAVQPKSQPAVAVGTFHPPVAAKPPPLVPYAGALLHTDFTTYPNGAPAKAGDGRRLVLDGGSTGTLPTVINHQLVTVGASPHAGYTEEQAGKSLHGIAGSFAFGKGAAADGSAALVLWHNLIPTPYAVPDSPLHFVVTPSEWTYGVWQGGKFTQLAGQAFDTPLTQNGTVYTDAAKISGDTATLSLPDGTTATVTNPLIGSIKARVANWENFLFKTGGATEGFTRVWAN